VYCNYQRKVAKYTNRGLVSIHVKPITANSWKVRENEGGVLYIYIFLPAL